MTELRLRSPHGNGLRELVTGALANESRLLLAGIQRTEARLREYEQTYRLSTDDFLRKFAENELDETLDLIDWVGEARLLQRLREKLAVLQDIQIES